MQKQKLKTFPGSGTSEAPVNSAYSFWPPRELRKTNIQQIQTSWGEQKDFEGVEVQGHLEIT